MKFVFFCIPAYGHMNPTLNVAKELVARGNIVYFYTDKTFQEKVEKAGLIFRLYTDYDKLDLRIGSNITESGKKVLEFVTEAKLSPMLEQTRKDEPDCIVHDAIALWGKIIATKLQVPAVSIITTFAITKRVFLAYPTVFYKYVRHILSQTKDNLRNIREYAKIVRKYRLHTSGIFDLFVNEESLNIVFTSKMLQPFGNTLGKRFIFVGPSIASSIQDTGFLKKAGRNPIVYISLGTIYNDDLYFYKTCLEAFRNTEYQIVLALGQRFSLSDLKNIPENVTISNYVPQLEVLKKSSLFITHAGMNSINESLYFGVPMICVPQIEEQKINALRVQQLKAGIILKEDEVTKESILGTAEEILKTRSYYNNAKKIQRSLLRAGGYKKAANEIVSYTARYRS